MSDNVKTVWVSKASQGKTTALFDGENTDQTLKKDYIYFGKYKGKTIDYIMENDVEYCKWVINFLPATSKHKSYVIKKLEGELKRTEINKVQSSCPTHSSI